MRIMILCILTWSAIMAQAQQPLLYHHFDGTNLSLRWKMVNARTWTKALNDGFQVTRTNVATGEVQQFEVRNQTLRFLNSAADDSPKYVVAKLLDSETNHSAYIEDIFEGAEVDFSDVDELRMELVDYVLNTNHQLIFNSGFGFKDEEIISSETLNYTITGPDNLKLEFVLEPETYEETKVSEVKPTWENKKVTLEWNTRANNEVFFGYEVHQSIAEAPFEILDTLLINPTDTSSDQALHFIYRQISLNNNDDPYTFRIYGRDYLGLRSQNFKEVTGQGSIGIGASPSIDRSDLLNTNEVHLAWSLYPEFEPNVKEWRIYVGEHWDGPYESDSLNIDPSTNHLIRSLPYENNFFRVAAVDLNGKEHSSFPVLVTHLDTIPPATPTNLTAVIDSNGIVDLTWDQNVEKDFYGYKVFFGFDSTREMTLAHFKAIPISIFKDTIGLKSLNRDLFYKVTAVDNRNNRSPFSKIVKLLKPDIIAPLSPNFYDYKSLPGGTQLAWHTSSSGDVVNQQLFRRNIEEEVDWTLVQEWQAPNMDSTFTESNLLPSSTYAYFMMAMDSSGNFSEPSKPVVIKTLPKHDVDLSRWDINLEENDSVLFNHDFVDPEIYNIQLIKASKDQPAHIVALLDIDTKSFTDRLPKKNQTYSYFIKIIYKDGYETEFSEPKNIRYE
ncbi:fibronectin type III domain-containing protein [Portibacter marinus]|uniref:hypothetical protein n=1 Tax=Portibacter marinus TaxID=2898660 RepID=UPI001F212F9E|nr:hypothetical protein [Portibacter marinus]